jgi:transposase InsO family protein
MRIINGTAKGARRLARYQYELTREASRRLKWMDYYEANGGNARLTCRHFDISPQTFYRWLRRYRPGNLKTLEERSRRPHQTRKPTWSNELAVAVQMLREKYPRWGKDKLAPLLREAGWECSTSMVGRILKDLKCRGVVTNASLKDPWQRRRPLKRPYGIRKPREYVAYSPGDIVEIDTADIRMQGYAFKHFTACDVVSRWHVLEVHSQATAASAASFLGSVLARMPFPVRAIQVDGGSEFMAQFETACQQFGIRLFVLPPRSPKLNGHVERAQRTHREEFYEVTDLPDSLHAINALLKDWEAVHNTYRPHQALGYLTPASWLAGEAA